MKTGNPPFARQLIDLCNISMEKEILLFDEAEETTEEETKKEGEEETSGETSEKTSDEKSDEE